MTWPQYCDHLRGVIEYLVLQQVKRGECYTLPDGECWGVDCVHAGRISGQPNRPDHGEQYNSVTGRPPKKVSARRLGRS